MRTLLGSSLPADLFAQISRALNLDSDEFSLLATVDAAMAIADASTDDMPLIYVNPAFTELTGYAAEAALGRNCRFLQGKDTADADRAAFKAGFATGQPFRVEILNYRADGSAFRNRVFISPLRDEEGRIRRFLSIQAGHPVLRGDSEAALHEFRHRVKNQMQAMVSLIALQARRAASPEVRAVLEDMRVRFFALSRITDDLSPTAGAGLDAHVEGLAREVAALFDPDGHHRLELDLAPLSIDADRAGRIGQILVELMMNAYRHAFAGRTGGTLTVRLTQPDPATAELTVADDGPGWTEPDPNRSHLGLSLVATLARGVSGEMSRRTEGGLSTAIRFPLQL